MGSAVSELGHTFLAVLEDRTVYVDVPAHEAGCPFPGWQIICRAAVIQQGLMTEAEAADAVFHAAVRPAPPSAHWR